MLNTKLLPKIKPANIKKSDKYSVMIYKYLRSNPTRYYITRHIKTGNLYLSSSSLEEPEDNWNVVTGADIMSIRCGRKNYTDPAVVCHTAKASFHTLWESINCHDSWKANPWVWVVEFKRVT